MAALQQSLIALKSHPSASPRPSSAVRSFSLRSSSSIAPSSLALSAARSTATPRRSRRQHGGATMMDPAAGSYANALADVAQSNGTLEATQSDMENVAQVFSEPAVTGYFANPTVEVEKKMETIDEIASACSLQPHTANFLKILVDMRRTDLTGEIAKEFEACYNKITGTELAVVTSVVQLESGHLAQIAKAVQRMTGAKNVRIRTAIDPALVAGFTVRYGPSGSKLIDMSVRKQLDEIASQLEFPDLVGSFA